MIIETLTLGALATNCYLTYDPESLEGIIIDPADEAEFLVEKIDRLKIKVVAIIATHGHFDHNLAAGELQLIVNNVPFFIHKDDLFLLKRMNDSASHWLGYKHQKPLPQNIKFLTPSNSQLSTFNPSASLRTSFQFIHTPGHTPGSICLFYSNKIGAGGATPLRQDFAGQAGWDAVPTRSFSEGGRKRQDPLTPILFSGDTLFKSAIGRFDFSYSSKEKLDASLKKIFTLPKDTVVFPGHGEITTIDDENQL